MVQIRFSAPLEGRDPSLAATDVEAVRAIAQAAVDVELFTIPLYMSAMYSLDSMHQITMAGNDFYKGRLWPGGSTKMNLKTHNNEAFNIIFSVFIQEMLHLQLAANIATAISKDVSAHVFYPTFSGPPLQNQDRGWVCYNGSSIIPNIVDLTDTKSYAKTKVKLDSIIENIDLFLAIEQSEKKAEEELGHNKKKYFPAVPFDGWKPGDALPLFGSIGYMYECLKGYLQIKYKEGPTLWERVFNAQAWQNDLFNSFSSGHPMREFMGFETTIATTWSDQARAQVINAMSAITDQGEGNTLDSRVASDGTVLTAVQGLQTEKRTLRDVKDSYRSSREAMHADYPRYSDTGKLANSPDAFARANSDPLDHYQRFERLKQMIDKKELTVWSGIKIWTAADLMNADYTAGPDDKILGPAATAAAMNALTATGAKAPNGDDYYTYLSKASAGAIAGVTSVLDQYWSASQQASSAVPFPFPSMGGTGDRMAIVWALFGKAPDLSLGCPAPAGDKLYHACQGLDFDPASKTYGTNACADVAVFHTCKGSNSCRAQGGCGFVHKTSGAGNCSQSVSPAQGGTRTSTALETRTLGARPVGVFNLKSASGSSNMCAEHGFSAPSDNKCGSLGGCAVPISAHQQYPTKGYMSLYYYVKDDGSYTSVPITGQELPFGGIESAQPNMYVHDVAYKAFKAAVAKMDPNGAVPPDPPAPSALRVALVPST